MNLRVPEIAVLFAAGITATGCATVSTAKQAQSRASQALGIIDQMQSQTQTAALLRNASAALIVLDYAKAAFIIGEQGGGGVLLTQHEGHWSDPAFYTLGGVSIGLQVGVESGPVAYVLMTPRAVQEFQNRGNRTTLGADAGLTVVKYSSDTNVASSFPTADVVVWTGTAGLFGGVALDSSHVIADRELQDAYHHGRAPAGAVGTP